MDRIERERSSAGLRRLTITAVLCFTATACTEISGTYEESEQLTPRSAALASLSSGHSYSLAGLPGLPTSSFALGVNNREQIVGWMRRSPGGMRAYVWRDGSVTELPGLGGPTSSAEDINERGSIVGHADNEEGYPRAVIWRRGRVMELGTLGGSVSFATAINDRGQVVGTAETAAGDLHAFLWSRGRMTDLGGLPGTEFSWGEDLNDRGTVVGWSAGGSLLQRATRWDEGEVVDLGTLAHESAALGINNRGQIVGASIPDVQTSALALIWERGEMRMLGTLGGIFSSAHGINAAGQVVGASQPPEGGQTAFIWQRNRMIDLGRRPGELANAHAINERGTVVGFSGGSVLWTVGRGTPVATASDAAPRQLSVHRHSTTGEPPAWAEAVCRARGQLGKPWTGIEVAAGC